MSSSRYKYGNSLRTTLKQAEADGFVVVKEGNGSSSIALTVSHPATNTQMRVKAFRADNAPGNLVKWLAKTIKAVTQIRRAAEKAKQEASTEPSLAEKLKGDYAVETRIPGAPPPVPAPAFEEQVKQAEETLVCWLDDRIKAGMVQFSIQMLAGREKIGLPLGSKGAKVIRAALSGLAHRNILSEGKLTAPHSNRQLTAFRLNNFNGTTIYDVYAGKQILAAPGAPSDDVPMTRPVEKVAPAAEAAPKPLPAPPAPPVAPPPASKPAVAAPVPPKPADSTGFISTLLSKAATNDEIVNQVIDTMIKNDQYEDLVGIIVSSGDVAEGVRVLKRVADCALRFRK